MLNYIFNLHNLQTHLSHCHCIHCLSAMSYKRTIIHVCPCLQSTHCPYISLIYYPNTRQTRNAANNKYSTKPISCSDFPLPSIFNATVHHCSSVLLFYCVFQLLPLLPHLLHYISIITLIPCPSRSGKLIHPKCDSTSLCTIN